MARKSGPESAVQRADPRHAVDLPARLVIEEGRPRAVRLINLSRGGFRIGGGPALPAGQAVRLEVDGWPRLIGRVMWCDGGRIGCLFDPAPSEAAYAMMRAAAKPDDEPRA
jgi:hypothetical protein